ncbi:hypothetical protein MKW98_000412 [Papaver atlanticum]|uniref:Fe2OG dioxygenase domain-containing protein n=1 Tax=Papaver atlanticum TaxID=357466 RepID=A0AAD4X7E6_9MAGN|nr:hypothetical protein MKW98_000412 [Papaver atlanticum]
MKGFRARKLDPIYLFPTEELPVAVNYLKKLLPFLTEGLCNKCNKLLLNRVDLLDQELSYQDPQPVQVPDVHCYEPTSSPANEDIDKYAYIPDECCGKKDESDTHSIGSWNNGEKGDCGSDTHSIGSWKNGEKGDCHFDTRSAGNWKDGEKGECHSDTHSIGSWNNGEKGDCDSDTQSIGSWKDGENGRLEPFVYKSELEVSTTSEASNVRMSWADMAQENGRLEPVVYKSELEVSTTSEAPNVRKSWADIARKNGGLEPVVYKSELEVSTTSEAPNVRMSWADMAQEEEDELQEYENSQQQSCDPGGVGSQEKKKPELSRETREYIRFMNVQRKKDFVCLERIKGKTVNVLEGLELHAGVFSAAEQKRIVDFVFELQEKGSRGELKERTYTAPQKWMRGKGRVTIQFGCCYNYAPDRKGNPPGILRNEHVDPIPNLLKVMIRRLVKWHVLPASCVPDSCIVNIYDEGDCIPPHIDNHDFIRPFCTVSFLSECDIVFGSNLKIVGPGEFSGSAAIPLPVGSVLVLQGNGADVAKHCVPAVPCKRISITFRKMDEGKCPLGFVPEPDLLGIQPLPYESDESNVLTVQVKSLISAKQRPVTRDGGNSNLSEKREGILGRAPTDDLGSHSEPRQTIQGTHSDNDGSHVEPWGRARGTLSDNGSSHSEPRLTTRGAHSEPRLAAQTARGTSQSEARQTAEGASHSEPQETSQETHSEPRPASIGTPQSEPRQTPRRTPWSQQTNRPREAHSEPQETSQETHSEPRRASLGTPQSDPRQTPRRTPWSQQTNRPREAHSEPQQTSQETHSEPRPASIGTPQSEPRQTPRRTPWSQHTYRPREAHSEPQQTSQETHSEPRPASTGTPQSEPLQTPRRTPWSQQTFRPRARRSVDR